MSNNHKTRETGHETLKTCIKHQGSKNGKLINKFNNSPINSQNPPLHLSRELYKSNLFMQNKANFKNDKIYISTCIINGYDNLRLIYRPKNKAKQTQNKANFSPKLGSFFPKLALNPPAPRSSKSEVGCQSAVKYGFLLGVRLWRDLAFWRVLRELCGEISCSSLKSCNLLIKNSLTHSINLLKSCVFSIAVEFIYEEFSCEKRGCSAAVVRC